MKIIITPVFSELCQLSNFQWRLVIAFEPGRRANYNRIERNTIRLESDVRKYTVICP